MCKTQKSDEQVNTHWDIEIIHWFKKAVLYRIDIGIDRYSEYLVSDRYRFWKSGIEPSLFGTSWGFIQSFCIYTFFCAKKKAVIILLNASCCGPQKWNKSYRFGMTWKWENYDFGSTKTESLIPKPLSNWCASSDPAFSRKEKSALNQRCEELRREQVKAAKNTTPVKVSFMIHPYSQLFLCWTKRNASLRDVTSRHGSLWNPRMLITSMCLRATSELVFR